MSSGRAGVCVSRDVLQKLVFVYGTLKRGQPNHHWLSREENGVARFLGTGRTTRPFPLVIGTRYNIPFLLDRCGIGHQVQGEVYEVNEAMLQNLDILEDYPRFYDREEQPILLDESKETVCCWLYLLRSFPDGLLAKEHLVSYRNSPEHPYTSGDERDSDKAARDDLDYTKEVPAVS